MSNTTIIVKKSTRDNLKELGRKNQTYDQLINQLYICDAVGCEQVGTEKILVEVGKFGTISLIVCKGCVGKFTD